MSMRMMHHSHTACTPPPIRRLRRSPALSIAAWALLVIGLLPGAGAWATAQPGEPAPDFSLHDTDGVLHTLSDYRGQVVLLFFVGWG
jgi:cytochrome oxidase Cu insertion factor (SCO1/SenC/PrrC family)